MFSTNHNPNLSPSANLQKMAISRKKINPYVFDTLHETDNNVILHREMATRGVKATCL